MRDDVEDCMEIIRLQEECAELIQILTKIQRFGLTDYNPNTGVKNCDLLLQETADVEVCIEQLRKKIEMPIWLLKPAREKKLCELKGWCNG